MKSNKTKPTAEKLYHYSFVANNPSHAALDKMYDYGLRLVKSQDGICYLVKSFISHREAQVICERCEVSATDCKRAGVA